MRHWWLCFDAHCCIACRVECSATPKGAPLPGLLATAQMTHRIGELRRWCACGLLVSWSQSNMHSYLCLCCWSDQLGPGLSLVNSVHLRAEIGETGEAISFQVSWGEWKLFLILRSLSDGLSLNLNRNWCTSTEYTVVSTWHFFLCLY